MCYGGIQVTLDAICMRRLVACLLMGDKARKPLTGCTRPFLYLAVVLCRDGCGCCSTSLHVLLQHCYEWRCSAFCCLCTIQSHNSAFCHHCMAKDPECHQLMIERSMAKHVRREASLPGLYRLLGRTCLKSPDLGDLTYSSRLSMASCCNAQCCSCHDTASMLSAAF